MKKKFLSCLAMLVCILGLTACGQEMTENDFITKEDAKTTCEEVCASLAEYQNMLDAYQMSMAEYVEMTGGNTQDAALIINAMNSWGDAAEEFGNYVGVIADETEVTITEDKADVKVKIQGDRIYKKTKERTATVQIVMTRKGYDSITVSTDYDMSELMTRAALNTLLGMGTVFAVLILISVLISCFNFIPKIQGMFSRKSTETASEPKAAVQAAPVVVEEADDTELIAVIAAAIAASEGAASADGYFVRSIIRR